MMKRYDAQSLGLLGVMCLILGLFPSVCLAQTSATNACRLKFRAFAMPQTIVVNNWSSSSAKLIVDKKDPLTVQGRNDCVVALTPGLHRVSVESGGRHEEQRFTLNSSVNFSERCDLDRTGFSCVSNPRSPGE